MRNDSSDKQVTQIRSQQPNPRLVEYCEELLAEARTGEVVALTGVVVYREGYTSEVWVSPDPGRSDIVPISDRVLGCLQRLVFRLCCNRHFIEHDDG